MSGSDTDTTPPTQDASPPEPAPLPTILRESTILLAMLTAAGYILGQVYLGSYYSRWGLTLSSLDLPTSEVLCAAGVFALGLMFGILPEPATRWLTNRLPKAPPDPTLEELIKVRSKLKLVLALVLLALGSFAVWQVVVGNVALLIACVIALVSTMALRPVRFLSAPQVLSSVRRSLGFFFALLVAAHGMGRAIASDADLATVTLYTTKEADWGGSGKPMRLILYRGGYWYVTETGERSAQIIPDSAVIRAEQKRP